jgi:hypothetical protein
MKVLAAPPKRRQKLQNPCRQISKGSLHLGMAAHKIHKTKLCCFRHSKGITGTYESAQCSAVQPLLSYHARQS